MSIINFIRQDISSYGFDISDIEMARRALFSSSLYAPSEDARVNHYTIQKGQEGAPIDFPIMGVSLTLMVLSYLARGEVAVLIPRFLQVSLDVAAALLHVAVKDIIFLLEQKQIPYENPEEKKILLQDLLDFDATRQVTKLREKDYSSQIVTFTPQDIIAVYHNHPELKHLVRNFAADQVYMIKRKTLGGPFSFKVPPNAMHVVFHILSKMTLAHALFTYPLKDNLSLDEAASILDISPSTLDKVLDEGLIPFEILESQKKIKLGDAIHYRDIQYQKALDALENMNKFIDKEIDDVT